MLRGVGPRLRQLRLEREATLTAIAVAQQLLTEKASDADHRALSDKFIQQLAAARGPRAS